MCTNSVVTNIFFTTSVFVCSAILSINGNYVPIEGF